MKNLPLRQEFAASGFFLLRTPLLPIEEFLNLASATAPSGPMATGKRAAARERLRQWVERAEVKEALWIASPELLLSLPTWLSDPESAKGRKLEQALYRYFARMTARATPFGAFAGCSTGVVAGSTRLELTPRASYRRSTRLDMEYLCSLAEHLSASREVVGDLRFRCNTTLHLAAGRYHHVRGDWQDGGRVFQLVGTAPTAPLDATLQRASSGATAGELAAALVAGHPDIALADAQGFIARLIESQILVPDLLPPVTGGEPIVYMAGELDKAHASGPAAELRSIHQQLRRLDAGGLGAEPASYDSITSAVQRLGGEFKPGRLVQLDLFKPVATATLDTNTVDAVLDAVGVLHSIRDQTAQTVFDEFKESFRQRYQDQEIPLLLALDDEAGIGFEDEDNPTAEPLIAAMDFRPAEAAATAPEETTPQEKPDGETPNPEQAAAPQGNTDADQPELPAKPAPEDNSPAAILARRIEELWTKKEMVLSLDPELLAQLKVENPLPMPDAFAVMGAAIRMADGQPGFYAHTIFGPSGANLLTRFRHGDQQLAEHVQAHVVAEEALEQSDAVFAEIVHLPEGRAGNVICRPVLRHYEIPLLATPGVPLDRQIALSDLTISLRDGRIVLRSRRLNKEVLPRLTTAHNFNNARSLKLYKFLCLLQHQGTCPDVFWDWGAAGKAAFMPRVVLGNIVFSIACWRISKETALELASGRTSIAQWREATMMPRFACIAEYDNQLLIDFENPLAVETFLEQIRKQTETVMVEMFPPPDALQVRGPEGTFVHEMVVPFVRRSPRALNAVGPHAAADADAAEPKLPAAQESDVFANDRAPASAGTAQPQTEFVPGSEWFFAKLYCSPSHADRILQELVHPLAEQVMQAGWARRWFYLRYGDPEWHVRLRFQGDPVALHEHVSPLFSRMVEEQKQQGTIWRLHFDTYEPETDRYGGPLAISVAEHLFQLDSELCLDLLPHTSADPDLRWQLAIGAVDCLLSALGLPLSDKELVTRTLARERERAFVVDQDYKQQLAQAFRSWRETLAKILSEAEAAVTSRSIAMAPAGLLPHAARAALARYSAALRPLGLRLEELRQSGALTQIMPDLATSFVHMHLNRAFRYRHHEQEAVVCELLSRMYASSIARGTGAAPTRT